MILRFVSGIVDPRRPSDSIFQGEREAHDESSIREVERCFRPLNDVAKKHTDFFHTYVKAICLVSFETNLGFKKE